MFRSRMGKAPSSSPRRRAKQKVEGFTFFFWPGWHLARANPNLSETNQLIVSWSPGATLDLFELWVLIFLFMFCPNIVPEPKGLSCNKCWGYTRSFSSVCISSCKKKSLQSIACSCYSLETFLSCKSTSLSCWLPLLWWLKGSPVASQLRFLRLVVGCGSGGLISPDIIQCRKGQRKCSSVSNSVQPVQTNPCLVWQYHLFVSRVNCGVGEIVCIGRLEETIGLH